MSDKIKQIRTRHEAGSPGEVPIAALCQCDADREFLLAEVDRLRSVISTLEIVGKAADDERAQLRAEVERLHAELRAMTAGFEVAWRAIGAKP